MFSVLSTSFPFAFRLKRKLASIARHNPTGPRKSATYRPPGGAKFENRKRQRAAAAAGAPRIDTDAVRSLVVGAFASFLSLSHSLFRQLNRASSLSLFWLFSLSLSLDALRALIVARSSFFLTRLPFFKTFYIYRCALAAHVYISRCIIYWLVEKFALSCIKQQL